MFLLWELLVKVLTIRPFLLPMGIHLPTSTGSRLFKKPGH